MDLDPGKSIGVCEYASTLPIIYMRANPQGFIPHGLPCSRQNPSGNRCYSAPYRWVRNIVLLKISIIDGAKLEITWPHPLAKCSAGLVLTSRSF